MAAAKPLWRFAAYWRRQVIGTVDLVAVNQRVHDQAGWTAQYLVMTTLSAGIAVLGLLLSSPAVVIGAMLISPLMGPIIGLGFALATVDARQIRRAAFALIAGSALAVLFAAAIVWLSPLQNVTDEIAGRTHPNLFDLLVALFAAIAGAYSTIRGGTGTIVGVAIATALMPPLATIGFGVATANAPVALGATLLFVTNFVTIAVAATIMARLFGFGSTLSPKQTAFQLMLVVATVVALAIPLGLALRRLASEGLAAKAAREEVARLFPDAARVSQVDVDITAHPIAIDAVVLTPTFRTDADRLAANAIGKRLSEQVRMTLHQYRVGTEAGDAATAAIQAAQKRTTAAPAPDAADEASIRRVAAVAGIDPATMLIDRDRHLIRATAAVLPGATLATYRAIEQRAGSGGWQVVLVPPPAAPPAITFVDAAPDAAALDVAAWGAQRLGYAIEATGPAARVATVIAALTQRAASATRRAGTAPPGRVELRWAPAPAPTPLPTPSPPTATEPSAPR